MQKYSKPKEKWEATVEATGRPLWRPLGGHWEATVVGGHWEATVLPPKEKN